MKLTLIAAIAENNVIGRKGEDGVGEIPWYILEDLKRFAKLTIGHPVIMGRKTAESIPDKYWSLSNRINYVLSRNQDYNPQGGPSVTKVASVAQVLRMITFGEPAVDNINFENAYVIGGESLYKEIMPIADVLEITHVHKHYEGDTLFPTINLDKWKEVMRDNREGYSFVKYEAIVKRVKNEQHRADKE